MKLKQVSILIGLSLFLLYDFLGIFMHQFVKQKKEYALQTDQKLITSYGVQLDSDSLKNLAQKINPDVGINKKEEQPFIAVMEPKPAESGGIDDLSEINIILMNGNGIDGNASGFADKLQKEGFTDIRITNTGSKYPETVVIYHPGNKPIAQLLQNLLIKDYNEIRLNPEGASLNIIEIILGEPAHL